MLKKKMFFKSWQVCGLVGEVVNHVGLYGSKWPRVARRSNVGLVRSPASVCKWLLSSNIVRMLSLNGAVTVGFKEVRLLLDKATSSSLFSQAKTSSGSDSRPQSLSERSLNSGSMLNELSLKLCNGFPERYRYCRCDALSNKECGTVW